MYSGRLLVNKVNKNVIDRQNGRFTFEELPSLNTDKTSDDTQDLFTDCSSHVNYQFLTYVLSSRMTYRP